MKKYSLIFLFFIISNTLFADIISWKGQEFGLNENPQWMKEYMESNNETEIRKNFNISSKDLIFYGYGEDDFIANAKKFAILNCEKVALDKFFEANPKNAKIMQLSGLQQFTDFWIQDSETGYKYYVFYKISKKDWKKNIKKKNNYFQSVTKSFLYGLKISNKIPSSRQTHP